MFCRKAIITLMVIAICEFDGVVSTDKMKLEDLKAITLEKGKFAASRRYSNPIPQLVCTGGDAGCQAYAPRTVRCINEGWDGLSVQWECKADMPDVYEFGTISVVCEGYDYPEDRFILKGSCSLEYTLELAGKASRPRERSYHSKTGEKQDSGWFYIYLLVVLVVAGYIIYSRFLSSDVNGRQHETRGGPDIGWNIPNAHYKESTTGGFDRPPPYSETAYNQYGSRSFPTNQGLGGGGGFWTGLGTGGLLGYMFGSQRNQAPRASRSSYTSGSFYPGTDSNDDRSSSTSGVRTATGYGGTKRR
ncbi:store-operated calcium entry-associated regulatory factor-like [Ischnura elegans]|uniref:store-operated calcium entry-associated regulatory factor-like n=1 Tax=Ischnura elegans TaxID=197161 RepID=UPI001ED87019|nr:store-operated calcium entry-associated regulatory factor-like [Ischnura elegans]